MAEAVGEAATLEFTPTWIVAAVCSLIVLISLLAERCLHYLGKTFKRKNQKPLYEAILKVKEELMLLGFISLLLTVFQGMIQKTCIRPGWALHMLPCQREEEGQAGEVGPTKEHFVTTRIIGRIGRRLLSEGAAGAGICQQKGKVPLMSLEAIHQLHIFIFVLAITHVVFSVLTMVLGGAKIHQWKHWEDAIQKDTAGNGPKKVTGVHNFEFIREHFKGIGKDSRILSWLQSFFKQFYGSVGKSDYTTMRLGFIMTHCRGNLKFDFHKYMLRVLESDFKKVVGISWYLWVFVVIFLLLNVNGWHTYFWIAFIPLLLLLAVGTKLEHVIAQLAQDVAEKHSAIEGDLIVKPSDDHFWFGRPRIVLFLIHFILFQNAFEIAFFFWILTTYGQDVAEKHSAIEGDLIVKPSDDHFWFGRPRIVLFLIHFILFQNAFEIAFFFWILTTYGFNSCIMGQVRFIVPRLVIGLIIQLLCSYSTMPLYAIVTQMGSSYKKEIFNEHVQQGVLGWAEKVKMKKGFKKSNTASGSTSAVNSAGPSVNSAGPSAKIEMMKPAAREGNNAGESIE